MGACDNVQHDLESLLEQISLARIITFSPPLDTLNFYTAEAHPLTFYIPFFTISYTFYSQMVLLSHTLLRTLYPF